MAIGCRVRVTAAGPYLDRTGTIVGLVDGRHFVHLDTIERPLLFASHELETE